MPKKMNRVELQNYVPEGNADGGQYTFNDGGSSSGDGGNKDGGRKPKITENKNDSSPKADVKTHKDFHEYIEKNHSGEFGKTLTENFDTGNDEAKSVINDLIKRGVNIIETKDGYCAMNGSPFKNGDTISLSGINVKLSGIDNFGEYSSSAKGDSFYHEFWHAADRGFNDNFITKEDIEVLDKKYGFDVYYYNRNLSTAKILSNGKTLFDTINDECHKISIDNKNGKWGRIIKNYKNDVNSLIGDFDLENNKKIIDKYEIEALKKFPFYDDTGKFIDNALKERKEYLKQIEEYNKAKKELNDYNLSKSKAESQVLRYWGSISDIYGLYKKTGYGFANMGHPGSYAKKPGTIAREFMAEYGSARSRTDEDAKKELGLFKKYFPEASKCAEEIYNLVVKGAK